jgi:hypothetical protein
VLARLTILKHDLFPGAQKSSLIDRVEGAPNYRGVSLFKIRDIVKSNESVAGGPNIYGIGMPTKDALLKTLAKLGISNGLQTVKRKVYWTSLREEPVIYVKGRPYVLRLFQDPLKNLETTGIARERVEVMEERMKLDVLAELRMYNNRILLHDEEMDMSSFKIVPVWESVSEEEVQTPLDLYKNLVDDGYPIDYLRIPMYESFLLYF